MKKIDLIILILVMSFFGACYRHEPKYGKDYNEQRKKIGLSLIPDDWELYKVTKTSSVWVNPKREINIDRKIPVHWSKDVSYDAHGLIAEYDVYYGSEDYITIDGTFRERLAITYRYRLDDSMDYKAHLGWNCRISNQETGKQGGERISLEEAEKILEGWGIKRLSYDRRTGNDTDSLPVQGR